MILKGFSVKRLGRLGGVSTKRCKYPIIKTGELIAGLGKEADFLAEKWYCSHIEALDLLSAYKGAIKIKVTYLKNGVSITKKNGTPLWYEAGKKEGSPIIENLNIDDRFALWQLKVVSRVNFRTLPKDLCKAVEFSSNYIAQKKGFFSLWLVNAYSNRLGFADIFINGLFNRQQNLKIRMISLENNNVTDNGAKFLSQIECLKEIDLSYNRKLTLVGIKAILDNKNIVSLKLNRCNLTDEGLFLFTEHGRHLKNLSLHGNNFSEANLNVFVKNLSSNINYLLISKDKEIQEKIDFAVKNSNFILRKLLWFSKNDSDAPYTDIQIIANNNQAPGNN